MRTLTALAFGVLPAIMLAGLADAATDETYLTRAPYLDDAAFGDQRFGP